MDLDLEKFCCQNAECVEHGVRNSGHLTVTSYYGKDNSKRMLRCSVCKYRFSETKGTVYFRSPKSKQEVDEILSHIKEGTGVRKTSRLLKIHRDTVTHYSRKAGKHAFKLHDEFVAFSPSNR